MKVRGRKGAIMMHSMDGGTARVIVGLDGSLACMGALRRAVTEARRAGTSLHAVAVVSPGHRYNMDLPDIRNDDVVLAAGQEQLRATFEAALGGVPDDVETVLAVIIGDAATALVSYADEPGDLLIVGTSQRRGVSRWLRRSVGRYCLAHATCPVLVLPLPAFARSLRRAHVTRGVNNVEELLHG
jgi:nucleotide-binding universal stress UspA family protein